MRDMLCNAALYYVGGLIALYSISGTVPDAWGFTPIVSWTLVAAIGIVLGSVLGAIISQVLK